MKNVKQIVLGVCAVCAFGAMASVQAKGGVAVGGAVTAPTVIHGVALAPAAHGGGGGGVAPVATTVHGLIITQAHGQTVVTKAPAAAGL